jgi:hypothetical protein
MNDRTAAAAPITLDRPAVGETNGLLNGPAYHAARREAETVDWSEPGLKVTRLRLLSDRYCDFWDVSYCDGELDGQPVRVELPFSQLPKREWKGAIINYAKREGIFAKRLGILDNVSTLC